MKHNKYSENLHTLRLMFSNNNPWAKRKTHPSVPLDQSVVTFLCYSKGGADRRQDFNPVPAQTSFTLPSLDFGP